MTIIDDDDGFPAVLTDSTGLPYRVKTRGLELAYVIIICLFGLMMGAFAGVDIYRGPQMPPLILALCLGGAVAAVYRLWLLRTPYLVFYPDRLEKRELTGWRTLMRSDVTGTRSGGGDSAGALLEVVPRPSGARSIAIRQALRKDPMIARWFKGARDLDAEAKASDQSAVLSDPRYGVTEADRKARLKTARTVATAFNLACVAAAIWMVFTPGLYQVQLCLVVAALLAGALLVRQSDGLIVWNAAGKARPAAIGALAPAGAAAYQSISLHILNNQPLLFGTALAAVALAALWAARNPTRFQWRAIPSLVFFGGFATYGLGALTDVALAPPGVTTFARAVTDKYTSGSRTTSYHLRVGAWGDQPDGPISVPQAYYAKTQIGSVVCIFRRHGALGLDWAEVGDCPAGSGIQPAVAALRPPPPGAPAYYPRAALQARKEGKAMVRCEVASGLKLTNCQVVSETPPGLGFGPAAIERLMSPEVHLNPAQLQGKSVVMVPVAFKLNP